MSPPPSFPSPLAKGKSGVGKNQDCSDVVVLVDTLSPERCLRSVLYRWSALDLKQIYIETRKMLSLKSPRVQASLPLGRVLTLSVWQPVPSDLLVMGQMPLSTRGTWYLILLGVHLTRSSQFCLTSHTRAHTHAYQRC